MYRQTPEPHAWHTHALFAEVHPSSSTLQASLLKRIFNLLLFPIPFAIGFCERGVHLISDASSVVRVIDWIMEEQQMFFISATENVCRRELISPRPFIAAF